jgi:hypothetical protein
MSSPTFVPAVELSGAFYQDVVRPLLVGRAHSAALLGRGSDVLGYDTPRSTDHDWGPRVQIFLDHDDQVAEFDDQLECRLPEEFQGWPVRFGTSGTAQGHHVTVTTLPSWLRGRLGTDAGSRMSVLDWLLVPQQQLLGCVAGTVHADDTGALTALRRDLAWYPDEVARWLVACQWHRIAQEEAFVARTAEVGDEVGSAVTAARLVRDLIRLAMLLDHRYWPYQKWLGTAFARRELGGQHRDGLPDHLTAALHARGVAQREAGLARAYAALAERHNASGLTEPLDPTIRPYHERPARVLMADRFATATAATVTDPTLRALPLLGSVDQIVDNVDVLCDPVRCRALAVLYTG